ncbi:MAG: GNAT family N-acetyltransferase [Bacteroidia bacterium]|nr:GNAT family N-acetyltransferase [Bacteroidia bacterium]MDW8347370.1 GNAT family N-acetyltransferase [Bacteroidia bacterium]
MVKIALAQSQDYYAIVKLIQQDEPNFTWNTFKHKYLTRTNNILLIALINRKIVGFIGGLAAVLENNQTIYWAVDAVVDIHHRKQGIATQLLKALIYYGEYVMGIGVKNSHILKAEINAGFKVGYHIHTCTYPPILPKRHALEYVSLPDAQRLMAQSIWKENTHQFDFYYSNQNLYQVLKDVAQDILVVVKKEAFGLRVMECSQNTAYLSMVVKVGQHYGRRVRFLINKRHVSLIKVMYKILAIPAKKPETLIYTHDFMQDLPIYFGHSDWFMEYDVLY